MICISLWKFIIIIHTWFCRDGKMYDTKKVTRKMYFDSMEELMRLVEN